MSVVPVPDLGSWKLFTFFVVVAEWSTVVSSVDSQSEVVFHLSPIAAVFLVISGIRVSRWYERLR